MNAGKFHLSYSAAAQMARLSREEKAALTRLLSSGETDQPSSTTATSDGRFVSRLGSKRVLWRRSQQKQPEILSIVDQSFATSG